jgi:signal transduction histidine kinase/tetratricopeptide (TPR) repeat protein
MLQLLPSLKDDTTKVKTLNSLSIELRQVGNSYDAKRHADEALALAGKLGFKKSEVDVRYNYGRIYAAEYNFPESMQWFQSSLALAEEIDYRKLIANNNAAIGTTHFYFGNYQAALKFHQTALELNKKMNSGPKSLIFSYNNIALDYWNLARFPEACKFYTMGLEIGIETKDSFNISWSYDALGQVYENEGNYPQAFKNFLAALKINTAIQNYGSIAGNNNNIGDIYRKQNNYKKALLHYSAALEANRNAGDEMQMASSYNSIGTIYRLQGMYTDAAQNILTSIELYQNIDFKYGLAYAFNNIALVRYRQALTSSSSDERAKFLNDALENAQHGIENFNAIGQHEGVAECYITIGLVNTEQAKYAEARIFLNDALGLSKELKVKEKIRDSYLAMASLDSITRNWEGAYINHKGYITYRDSLLNEENTHKIRSLEMQYEYGRKEDSLRYQHVVFEKRLSDQMFLTQQQQQRLSLRESELAIANNERRINELELEKNLAANAVQAVEIENKENALTLMNKEKEIQALNLRKQRILSNYLLGGLAVFFILTFFVYNNYLIRQRLKLQTLRNKIASDLHDDVGSTLSSISIFAEIAKKQSKEIIPALQTISESSRKMLDAMADIVWTINPENDQFDKILMRMRSFAYELLGAKKIDFVFKAEGDMEKIKLSMEARKNLFLIFKEATNNMVKYAEASKASYFIKNEQEYLVMMIRDNGKGFDMNKPSQGNGLKNMKKRAEEVGGILSIDSLPGSGTSIQFKIAV